MTAGLAGPPAGASPPGGLKVVKPFSLVMVKRAYAEGGRRALFVGCGAAFRLDQPGQLVTEQAMWAAIAKDVPAPAIFDAGFPKPAGEMLVAGGAAAPGGTPITGLVVTAAVGTVRRRLAVFGNRTWRSKSGVAVFSEPEPFLTLPLTPSLAFGGPGVPANPGGIGGNAQAQLAAGLAAPLPNIERADRPIRHLNDTPAPAIAGPLDITDPSRAKLAGTYDAAWLKDGYPGLARDADPALFHAAQPEQRLPRGGYFQGNEAWEVAGMHPDHPYLTGHLPDLRPRAFARLRTPAGPALREVALQCETVWLFGTALMGVVLWRGTLPVAEPEAADVEVLMLAAERPGDVTRDAAHYAEQMRLRTDKDTAGLYALSTKGLMPDPLPADRARRDAARAEARAVMQAQSQRTMDHFTGKALATLDPKLLRHVPPMPPVSLPDDAPVVTAEEIAAGEVDLVGIVDFARAQGDKARALLPPGVTAANAHGLVMESLGAMMRGEPPGPGALLAPDAITSFGALLDNLAAMPAMPQAELAKLADLTIINPAVPPADAEAAKAIAARAVASVPADPAATARAMIEKIIAPPAADGETWEDARRRAFNERRLLPETTVQTLMDQLDEAERGMAQADEQRAKAEAKQADAMAGTPFPITPSAAPPPDAAALIAGLLAGTGPRIPEPSDPARAGDVQQGRDAVAKAMAGMTDLLATLPFPGMAEEMLAAAASAPPGALPDIAKVRADVLARVAAAEESYAAGMAKLDGARRFTPTAMAPSKPVPDDVAARLGALAAEEHAAGRGLAGRDFAGAARPGGTFAGADAAGSFWERAALSGSTWAGARLSRAVFTGADLGHADLTGADLTEANLSGTWLARADLTGADLSGAVLHGFTARRAILNRTRLRKAVLIKADLGRVSLRGAQVDSSMFIEADLAGADLRGARFERCMFIRSTLAGAQAAGATFIQCAFIETDAAGIDLDGATLRRVAVISDKTCFRGATLTRMEADGTTWMATDLAGADLTGANLAGATMIGAVLDSAVLRGTVLRRAMLTDARLQDADLRDADLFEAALRGTDLCRADLTGANLYGTDMTNAVLQLADLTDANLRVTQFEAPPHAA